MTEYYCNHEVKNKIIDFSIDYVTERLGKFDYQLNGNFSVVEKNDTVLLLSCPCEYEFEENTFKDKLSIHIEWDKIDNQHFLTQLHIDVYACKSGNEIFSFSFNPGSGFQKAILNHYLQLTVYDERESLKENLASNTRQHSSLKRI